MIITELTTQHDSRQSFYGKAHIIEKKNGKRYLLSYTTEVAVYAPATEKISVFQIHSATTLRHIKEFIYQITGEVLTKGEIETKYM